eukprot:Nk52_evm38s2209 gene=Nk52_evmTU38s2209
MASFTFKAKINKPLKATAKVSTTGVKRQWDNEDDFGDDREEKKVFLNTFDKDSIGEKEKSAKDFVIPLIKENRWKKEGDESPGKGKDLDKEAANEILSEIEAGKSEGLEDNQAVIPLLMKNRAPGSENIMSEDEKFKIDVQLRPDECGVDAYTEMPVEHFGAALLRGMGWKEGQPIGLTNKKLVKPVEASQKLNRGGLGATPSDLFDKKKGKLPKKPNMVDSSSKSGKTEQPTVGLSAKEGATADKELKQNSWLRKGITVRIVSKSFKRGKYYREKVEVIAVFDNRKECDCKTDDGVVLRDMREKELETVLPRGLGGTVVVVWGKHIGKTGKIIRKDKDKCRALVELQNQNGNGPGGKVDLDFDDISQKVISR